MVLLKETLLHEVERNGGPSLSFFLLCFESNYSSLGIKSRRGLHSETIWVIRAG